MKKTLLLGAFLLAAFGANAQTAPDFTTTDIDGNTHTLSDYLNAGKTVIMDISATWCGPCWNYHGTHALADLYESYGQGGSNEVVVLFVEGDPATTLDNLHGISGPAYSQGDWTAHSPYPIIDDANISELYNLEHFPTILRICPDGTYEEVGQLTAKNLKNSVNTACLPAESPLVGVNDKARLDVASIRYCEENGAYKATVKNLGTNAMTSAVIELREGETVLTTKNYTGNVAQFGNAAITFDAVDFTAGEHSVVITSINGNAFTGETGTEEVSITPNAASETNNNFEVRLYTDNYPGEISFKIKNMATGSTVFTSPALTAGTGEAGAGGPDANTTKSYFVSLPAETLECYKIELKDSYGDGWSVGSTEHGLRVFNGEEIVFEQLTPSAFATITVDAALKSNGVMATPTIEAEGFSVYPNPTTGVINFTTQEAVDVMIMDLTGKVVLTAKGIENGGSVNIGSLQSGMYIAKINGQNSERIEKIIKQ
jgi:hypothetical protein